MNGYFPSGQHITIINTSFFARPDGDRRVYGGKFKISKSVHLHTVQTNQPTRYNNFSSLLLDVYVQLNMFRAPSRSSSGPQLQYQPLVLPSERGDSCAVGRGRASRQTGPTGTNSAAIATLRR
jgi:hypothetical protein